MTAEAEHFLFLDRVSKAVSHALRAHRGAALLYVRLTASLSGSELAAVAARIAACARYPDSVAQLEDQAFAILMTEFGRPEEAGLLAMRLGQAVAAAQDAGPESAMVAHVGIALAPYESEEPEALITAARAAAEAAASAGEALRYSLDEMNRVARVRAEISRDLPRALEAEELLLHYHPQLHLESGRITGAEALLRWSHPDRGLLLPGEFVPLAESFGPMGQITAWVLRRACEDALRWPEAGLRVAVNLSPRQLEDEGTVGLLSGILGASGLPADRLELEITESAIMRDLDLAARQLQQLRDLGVALSLDDFGTGYSSLTLLKQLPVTKLKIDRSFVEGLGQDRGDAAIVRALIDLGRGMGLEVLAEGVERDEQLTFLREAGCTTAQGDHISPPVESEIFAGVVGASN